MVICGIGTYVYSNGIKLVQSQLRYPFGDQSNLIWKSYSRVVFYMSEDAKLYRDVDFKQSYLLSGLQLLLYSFWSFLSYSGGVAPLDMTCDVLLKLFAHIYPPCKVNIPIFHLHPKLWTCLHKYPLPAINSRMETDPTVKITIPTMIG
jgi:hypothetical protein